jgi:chorismate synthase
MPANTFGEMFRITTFGESHGDGIGVVVDGCPAGLEISEVDIQAELDRRRPGQSHITTDRNEADKVKILSGIYNGKTTGTPIAMVVFNTDQRSHDYNALQDLYRPGHSDFTYQQKYQNRDPRGGGRSSARIMIGRVVAGAIAKKFLKEKLGVEFLAYTSQVGEIGVGDLKRNFTNFELSTQRLILKAINFDYLEDIFAEFTPEVTRFMFPKPADKISETAEFISGAVSANQRGEDLQLVILDKDTGEFLGCCGVHDPHAKTPEFGIWLKKSAHRKGCGREAMTALKVWADQNLDYDYIKYPVDRANISSRKIPESLGGVVQSEYKHTGMGGQNLDLVEYHIIKDRNKESALKSIYETVTSDQIEANIVRCPDPEVAQKMIELIEKAKTEKDSLGGVITGVIRGLPVGLGEPEFDKFPALLAHAMLSINATKGFEIGSGFEGTKLKGSEHNDEFVKNDNPSSYGTTPLEGAKYSSSITTKTNHAGGVLGGITNGQTVYFKVAFKPVATIGKSQKTLDNNGNEVIVVGKGRHDPCVLPRAVPIVEAMSALVAIDLYLRGLKSRA